MTLKIILAKDEFIESWDQEDGEPGNGWIVAHNEHPKWWDEFKLLDGVPVTHNPDTGLICSHDNSGGKSSILP